MSRKMLINAQNPEELRVAIISGGTLDSYEVAAAESGLTRGNIYRGIVSTIQPSLNAAFVDIGCERDGLLPAHDVVADAYHRRSSDGDRHPRIDRILERGRPILVQVAREGQDRKGPALTSNISLAGRYLVLTPLEKVRGISRKVEDDESRRRIRDRIAHLKLPDGCGVIARTNAEDQTKKALNSDLNALLRLWRRIRREMDQPGAKNKGPRLLYSDQDLLVQALRDLLDSTVGEVLVDDDDAFAKAERYMQAFMPRARTRLIRYSERMPLFSRFELETEIDRIYQRQVSLPSGGSIVIDRTEALTAIDVNSGRATRGASHEETAHNTNMEAAKEVALQLRLRDIGGLMVVDFIDMRSQKHQRAVEKAVRDAMKVDRARFSVGKISPNGLLEINRQRIKKALQLRTHRTCPTCSGVGSIASPELVAMNLLRRIETRAVTGRLRAVRIGLHPELADAIQNGHRQQIADLEREFAINVTVNALSSLHRSEEKLDWTLGDVKTRTAARAAARAGTDRAAVRAADVADNTSSPAPTAGADTGAKDDGETSPDKPDKPRRRRRGGRRRKRSTDTAADRANGGGNGSDGASDSGNPASDSSAPPKGTPDRDNSNGPEEAPSGDGESSAKKRRRRRRR